MAGEMVILQLMFCLILASPLAATKGSLVFLQPQANQRDNGKAGLPAEDISGTYSFFKEGELLQINLDKDGVSGYISRMGELESDRGTFLDHFFTKAAIKVLIICYCSFVGQNVLRAHKTDAPPIRIAIPSARNRADRFRGCVLITVGTIALVLALYVLPWLAQQDFGR